MIIAIYNIINIIYHTTLDLIQSYDYFTDTVMRVNIVV